jgi:hypothetical protein
MKYLSSVLIVFTLVLSACGNIIPGQQDNTLNEPASAEEKQVVTSADHDTAQGGPEIKVDVVGGDDASLREFIKQWMNPGAYPGSSFEDMTVYIGSTPEDLPFEPPVPEGARTIGSITGGWVDYQLLYDSDLDLQALNEFYSKNLPDQGWQQAPTNQGQGGFVSQSDQYQYYCQKDGKAYLTVEIPSTSEAKTGIRITLDTSPDSHLCDASAANTGYSHDKLLPQLKAPAGTSVQGGGAGMSDRDAETSASLSSKLSPGELLEIYNQQLVDAGWKMQNSENGEGGAWSQWTLKDEQGKEWLGSLIIVKSSPDSDSLYALLRIEKGE